MERSRTAARSPVRRRVVLRGLGAGVLAATGAGTVGTVTAQSDDVTVLDVRESGELELPVVDELLIFAHGWFGSSAGPGQAADLAGVLSAGGYEPDEVVALVYQADASSPEAAFVQAEDAVSDFVPIVQAAIDAGVGSIRLAGHSLGGRVVLGTLSNLDDGYVVDTVAPMGAAAVGSTVTEGGRWYEGVANHAAAVRNYHSRNDSVIMGDFGPDSQFGSQGDTALGAQGVPDPAAAPDTYTDVDVTDSVSGHGGYTSNSALGADLAAAIAEQDDGGQTPTERPTTTDRPTTTSGDDTPGRVGSNTAAPNDPDDDGLYEDVNGNARQDIADAVDLFRNRESVDAEYFDFTESGGMSIGDAVSLFRENTG